MVEIDLIYQTIQANSVFIQPIFSQQPKAFGRYLMGATTDNMNEQNVRDRERVFNLGYYTWVEQQGVDLADFDARHDPDFWNNLMDTVPVWDQMIDQFNQTAS